eukprot:gene17889-23505_t
MSITDYQTWHSVELTSLTTSTKIAKMVRELSHGALYKVTGGEVGGAEAITGYISNLAPGFIEPMPFVCFRGTQSHSDALNNVICLVTEDFYSHKGTLIGKTGLGFINHYHSLCQLRKNIDNKEIGIFDLIIERGLKSKQGILVCGHSLGAAVGLLLAAELHTDYGDSIPIHLVTFGSPRIFDKETSSRVHKFDLRHHMRFINSGDLVTVLGEQSTIPLTHSGTPYIFPPIITSDDSQSNDLIVIDDSNSFDWSLRPPDIGRATLTFAAAEGRYHRLKDIDILSLLIAAICHDIDHTGHNNNFEIASRSSLAILYSDDMVLERHHAAMTNKLLMTPDIDFLKNVSKEDKTYIRKQITNAIFGTDMSKHFEVVEQLTTHISLNPIFNIDDLVDRTKLCRYVLHSADIGAQTQDETLSSKWTNCCIQEFYNQTLLEQQLSLENEEEDDLVCTLTSDGVLSCENKVARSASIVLINEYSVQTDFNSSQLALRVRSFSEDEVLNNYTSARNSNGSGAGTPITTKSLRGRAQSDDDTVNKLTAYKTILSGENSPIINESYNSIRARSGNGSNNSLNQDNSEISSLNNMTIDNYNI